MAKRTVTYDGKTYKVRSDKIEIPDLDGMDRFDALTWLCQNTYARGYSRPASGHELRGLAGLVRVSER